MSIKYFTCANSCKGFVNLTKGNVENVSRRFLLSCPSKSAVSSFIKRTGEYFENKGHNVEYILNPTDEKTFMGCIVRLLDFCVLDKKIYDEGIVIELGDCESDREVNKCYGKMHRSYQEGKEIHDEWEKLYISNMDFEKLDKFKKETIKEMFKEKRVSRTPQSVERFFGSTTKNGYVNLICDLTENIGKRYFIKGRPGTGKSTFMKEVAKEAAKRGFDTEIYRCSFDPDSLDMVIVPDAHFCVFDSTSPHEMFPERQGDTVLDFYKESGLAGIDEKLENEIKEISAKYKEKIKEGAKHLENALNLERENPINPTTIEHMFKMLIAEIEKE